MKDHRSVRSYTQEITADLHSVGRVP